MPKNKPDPKVQRALVLLADFKWRAAYLDRLNSKLSKVIASFSAKQLDDYLYFSTKRRQ